jgi:hypothetical protein
MTLIEIRDEAGDQWELRDIAAALYWAGFALFGAYITNLLLVAWPLALLQPAWQERLARGLVEGAIYPLVGACLVLLAGLLDPKHDALARRVRRVRALAMGAALGFALLIPLQTLAGVRLLRAAAADGQQRLQQVRRATEAMEKSTTASELRSAILQIPGIEAPQLPATFNRPVPELRARLVERLRPQIKAVENRLEEELAQRWQNWLLKALRDALMAGFFAVGFAAIGRSAPRRPTLLWSLTNRRNVPRAPRGVSDPGGIPAEWLPEEEPPLSRQGEPGSKDSRP